MKSNLLCGAFVFHFHLQFLFSIFCQYYDVSGDNPLLDFCYSCFHEFLFVCICCEPKFDFVIAAFGMEWAF